MRLLFLSASIVTIALLLAACGGGQPVVPTPQPTTPPATPTVGPEPTPPGGNVVEVGLLDPGGTGNQADPGGSGYVFSPSEFTFSAGETVTFVLEAETEFHTFTVDELGINAEVDAGETETFEFTFDEPGEYNLICIPHEVLGMTGTITVQ